MIPCTIRSGVRNALKQSLVKQSAVQLSKKPYSTSTEEEHSTTQAKEEPEQKKHFWEISDQFDRHSSTRSVKSRTTKAAAEQRDFRDLLDTLFDRKSYKSAKELTPLSKKASSSSSKTDSVIEKKLLELIVKNRQLYKEKAPLPRGLMAPIYGKSSTAFRKQQQKKQQEEEENFLDFLNPKSSSIDEQQHPNWDMKSVVQNKRIQEKEQELQAINTIIETQSSIDLLSCIQTHIHQETYPKYYPRILTKAIEQAIARNDPYLACTIFELAKTKSMTSYVLGCTTQVYDAMLLLRWEVWRDAYGMLELVEEMTVNGVQYSNDSRRIIRAVVQEIEAEGGVQEEEEEQKDKGIYWNADEKRACHVMKELVGKWIIQ